ncbi:MAG: hypothetical protein HY645_06195 [Acidobacteria bacterium]|nr:hypothetical protein [Acidobacteriota bacterium]
MRRPVFLFLLAGWVLGASLYAQVPADLVLYNGQILTVDSNFSIVQAVAVREGKIIAVGASDDVLELAGPSTTRLDLKGKTVIPGIVHSHTHVNQAAEGRYGGELGAEGLLQYPPQLENR